MLDNATSVMLSWYEHEALVDKLIKVAYYCTVAVGVYKSFQHVV